MAKKKVSKKKRNNLQELSKYIIALLSIALIIVLIFKLGIVGVIGSKLLIGIFGLIPFYFILLILLGYFGYLLYFAKYLNISSRYVVGSLIGMVGLMLLFGAIDSKEAGFKAIDLSLLKGGHLGLVQLLLYGLFSALFSKSGTYIFAFIFILIALVIYFMISLSTFLQNRYQNIESNLVNTKQFLNERRELKEERKLIKKHQKIKDFFKDQKPEDIIDVDEFDYENPTEHHDIITSQEIIIHPEVVDVVVEEDLPFDDSDIIEEVIDLDQEIHINKNIKLDKNLQATKYKLPSFDLLSNPMSSNALEVNTKNANEKAILLTNFLKDFNLDVSINKINIGPSITKFELTLQAGIRVNRIASLSDDIKMALAVKEIRIEAPIPGKSAIGIEIPNVKNSLITLKEVLNDINFTKENKLVFGLGKDINGQSIYTSLNKMPHLLVAGSTGSGKSVCINSIITSILMNAHYEEVKLLLIDPKKVELNIYNDIPHLLAPVVSDAKQASKALRRVVEEMDRRYELFAHYNCKNIEGYNDFVDRFNKKKPKDEALKKLPFIVVIIDELADLMMVSPKDVEECIMRITQMARAAGIHLIVATQRPSTDVITGVIKANIPSRIAFAVSSSIDSRTILDMMGAEKLLGKGDMLFYPTGMSVPVRIQGAFLSDDEVGKVVYAIKQQHIAIHNDEAFTSLDEVSSNGGTSSEDDLYYEVEDFVKRQDKVSTSFIQRNFKVGYNRAARLIDDLEAAGIISGANGSKPREVLIKNEELE